MTLFKSSRLAIRAVELLMAASMLHLSAYPLVQNFEFGYNPAGLPPLEYFLSGAGTLTSGFWLRLVAVVVSAWLLVIVLTPGEKWLKARTNLNFAMAMLYLYVTFLSWLFVDFTQYFWIQPLAYTLISAMVYLANRGVRYHAEHGDFN